MRLFVTTDNLDPEDGVRSRGSFVHAGPRRVPQSLAFFHGLDDVVGVFDVTLGQAFDVDVPVRTVQDF